MNTESIKSLVWTALAITVGAIAFSRVGGNAQSPTSPIVVERTGGERHQIECLVSSMEDIGIVEGTAVHPNQTVCSNQSAIAELKYRKQMIESAITTPPPKAEFIPMELPPADFSAEENTLAIARAKLAQLEANPADPLNFYNPEDSRLYEPGIFQRYQDYQIAIADARYEVAQAIAELNAAKASRQRYEFQIQQDNQIRQAEAIATATEQQQAWTQQQMQLSAELAKINGELESTPRIVSPYRGKVSRVKIISQDSAGIKVQITIQKND
ncbi:MAG: hypothetical protein ACP5D7_20065 [Limnospira sp.]